MRVDPSTNATSPAATTQAEAIAARPAARSAANANAPATTASSAGSFAMTEQLSQLLGAVRSLPDVRSEAVSSASAKLASGELDTPQAANETASALLPDVTGPTP